MPFASNHRPSRIVAALVASFVTAMFVNGPFSLAICRAAEPVAEPAAKPSAGLQLKSGDVVALCGDSITSAGRYPRFLEIYQHLCAPEMKVSWKNCGRWGEVSRQFPKTMDKDFTPAKPTVMLMCYGMNNGRGGSVFSPKSLADEQESLKTIIDAFKAAGGRVVVLASPGCVDTTFHPRPPEANRSLKQLGDNARDLAAKQGYIFADMHGAMIEVMAKAKAKYGSDYPFAGGKGDGLHPGDAGHLVMAWVYLKALGYDGDIGTFAVDLGTNKATATTGHTVQSFAGGTLQLVSTRYPFCSMEDSNNLKEKIYTNANSTRSVIELFPFNEDLNRLKLVVKGSKAKRLRVTWSGVDEKGASKAIASKEFDSATLEKGINLAAEFLENPFTDPFRRILTALVERNNCINWLKQDQYKNDPGMQKRLERALAAMQVKPVTHTIKLEPLP